MAGRLGVYIPCGYWTGTNIRGEILFKEIGSSAFVSVHRSQYDCAPYSDYAGFVDVGGTLDGRFMVAVGCEPFKHSMTTRYPAIMSYAVDGTWYDVAGINPDWCFVSCYVPESGVAYISGFDDSTSTSWKTARIWKWTPTGGFVEVHSYYANSGWPVFYWLSGVGYYIAGGMHYTGAPVYSPGRWTLRRTDGVWYDDPGDRGNYVLPAVVSESLIWGNCLRNWVGGASYLRRWDGAAWSTIDTHNAAGSDINHSVAGTADYMLAGHNDATSNNSIWRSTGSGKTKVLHLNDYSVGITISPDNGLDCLVTRHWTTGVAYHESTDGGVTWGAQQNYTTDNSRYPGRPFFADLQDPPFATIAEDGGYELTLEGTFPAGVELEVYIGPNADEDTDEPCYGGEGYGYSPISEDGTSLTVITPQLGVGVQKVSWRQAGGGDTAQLGRVSVLERNWPMRQLTAKANFPPWVDIGSSRLDGEPLRDEAVEPPAPTAPATWGAGGRWGISTWNTAP